MKRDYQYNYSDIEPEVFDVEGRVRKARTTLAVLEDYLSRDLKELSLLDVGGSTGIIDNELTKHFGKVVGIDIDDGAIKYAREHFEAENLFFQVGDAMALEFEDESVDVVVCSHVYEHVPDPSTMMQEIHRVLKPGGACYFAANSRLMIMEPHYNLPFLSVMPRWLAHRYMRLAGKGDYYYEEHYSYWGLKKLVAAFRIHDYSAKVINEPDKFRVEYMLPPGSLKAKIAAMVVKFAYWASPYIWMLEKKN